MPCGIVPVCNLSDTVYITIICNMFIPTFYVSTLWLKYLALKEMQSLNRVTGGEIHYHDKITAHAVLNGASSRYA